MLPTGFKFNPTDEELIQILQNKVAGHATPLHFIIEANLYDREPQDIEWDQTVAVSNKERYYFCKRVNDSREVCGRGWWKATSHVKAIYDGQGRVVGYKKPMTFYRFRDVNNGDGKRTNAIKTDWLMHEFGLHSPPSEWRLCKIKYKGKQIRVEDVGRESGRKSRFEAGSNSSNTREQPVGDSSVITKPICGENSMGIELGHFNEQMEEYSSFYDQYSHLEPLTDTVYYQFGQDWDQPASTDEQPFSDLWS